MCRDTDDGNQDDDDDDEDIKMTRKKEEHVVTAYTHTHTDTYIFCQWICVMRLAMMLMDDQYLLRSRAKPKSQSFTTPSLVRRMFSGLTSRWMQLWAWQYPTACNVCQMIRFVNTSGTLHRESRDRSFPVLKTLYLSPGHKHGHSPPAVDGHYIWTFWVADSPSQHLLRIQLETSSPLDLHPYEKSCIHRHWSIQADE